MAHTCPSLPTLTSGAGNESRHGDASSHSMHATQSAQGEAQYLVQDTEGGRKRLRSPGEDTELIQQNKTPKREHHQSPGQVGLPSAPLPAFITSTPKPAKKEVTPDDTIFSPPPLLPTPVLSSLSSSTGSSLSSSQAEILNPLSKSTVRPLKSEEILPPDPTPGLVTIDIPEPPQLTSSSSFSSASSSAPSSASSSSFTKDTESSSSVLVSDEEELQKQKLSEHTATKTNGNSDSTSGSSSVNNPPVPHPLYYHQQQQLLQHLQYHQGNNLEITEEEQENDQHDSQDENVIGITDEFDPYLFIASLPEKPPTFSTVLPPKIKPVKKTLVLDLDETLVHCSLQQVNSPDLIFSVDYFGTEYSVFVKKRPGFEKFLEKVSKIFEIVVFTASQKIYADKLLTLLDPQAIYFDFRLFRDACINVNGNYIKDLTALGRDLSSVVIIDNSPHVFGYQINNGIPILGFYEDEHDTELIKLLPLLETLCEANSVQPVLKDKFKLYKKVNNHKRQLRALLQAMHASAHTASSSSSSTHTPTSNTSFSSSSTTSGSSLSPSTIPIHIPVPVPPLSLVYADDTNVDANTVESTSLSSNEDYMSSYISFHEATSESSDLTSDSCSVYTAGNTSPASSELSGSPSASSLSPSVSLQPGTDYNCTTPPNNTQTTTTKPSDALRQS